MSNNDYLLARFPTLGERLPRMRLANLPTPVRMVDVQLDSGNRSLSVKCDDLTGIIYGGNKVRKLEYIFARARDKHCRRLATFGAVGSNSALATALYARQSGFECTCFLMHQARTAQIPATLNRHIQNETELVRYGGSYQQRLQTLRDNLWGRTAWVIPMGGSSWRGTVGFVAAGLELAEQIAVGEISKPDRIYVATGTMGTAIGIALGLAIADLDTEVHAVRASDTAITNEHLMKNLTDKTVSMMRQLDDSVPRDLADRTNIRLRNNYYGGAYARSTPEAEAAIAFAKEQLDITLESTYTGKAMAALLADLKTPGTEALNILFWNTYYAMPVTVPTDHPLDEKALPEEFLRYFG
ncbi:MAG: pyridoxal-phosphate dependent enzyme [Gammaproteobacteria bacterium]|nr:MAG: pyridoxal-phosphate dependent enzyme [Gammaproteobacteria bacterium]